MEPGAWGRCSRSSYYESGQLQLQLQLHPGQVQFACVPTFLALCKGTQEHGPAVTSIPCCWIRSLGLKTKHLILREGESLRLDSASYQGKLAAQPHSVGKVALAAGR